MAKSALPSDWRTLRPARRSEDSTTALVELCFDECSLCLRIFCTSFSAASISSSLTSKTLRNIFLRVMLLIFRNPLIERFALSFSKSSIVIVGNSPNSQEKVMGGPTRTSGWSPTMRLYSLRSMLPNRTSRLRTEGAISFSTSKLPSDSLIKMTSATLLKLVFFGISSFVLIAIERVVLVCPDSWVVCQSFVLHTL